MQPPLLQIRKAQGIHIASPDLWFDAMRKQSVGVVTHAHSDHARWHAQTITTSATRALMEARLGLTRGEVLELDFGIPQECPEYRLTLFPAGHILGSAQVFLETERESLLYSGDFKMRPGKTAEAFEAPQADTLILETTFGTPFYRFPPVERVAEQIREFCRESLEAGYSPILLAYSLGKAQEVLARLGDCGFPIAVHTSVDRMTQVYQKQGILFPDYEVFAAEMDFCQVLLFPPQTRNQIPRSMKTRSALISGWALNPRARYQFQCDAAFPLSDHADYEELLAYVKLVQPKRVFTVHGSTEEFARDLRRMGVEALALGGRNQLELSLQF